MGQSPLHIKGSEGRETELDLWKDPLNAENTQARSAHSQS